MDGGSPGHYRSSYERVCTLVPVFSESQTAQLVMSGFVLCQLSLIWHLGAHLNDILAEPVVLLLDLFPLHLVLHFREGASFVIFHWRGFYLINIDQTAEESIVFFTKLI